MLQNECVSLRFELGTFLGRSVPLPDYVAEVLVFPEELAIGAPQFLCLLMEAPLRALELPQLEVFSLKTYK